MGKYIRTKNRMFQDSVPNQEKEREILLRCYQDDFGKCEIADTIEELCDELVADEPNNEDCPRPYVVDYWRLPGYNSWFNRELESIKNGNTIVYGAIWTDKVLIYVAKMNEKGELELL